MQKSLFCFVKPKIPISFDASRLTGIVVANGKMFHRKREVNSSKLSAAIDSPLPFLEEIGSLQATLAELTRQVGLNWNQQEKGQSILINNQTLAYVYRPRRSHKPMDEMPDTTTVSETNRKLILSHKHVNLASLLILSVENMCDQTRIIDTHGNQVVVKSNDPRLARMLTIDECSTALHKFIDVTCDDTEGCYSVIY